MATMSARITGPAPRPTARSRSRGRPRCATRSRPARALRRARTWRPRRRGSRSCRRGSNSRGRTCPLDAHDLAGRQSFHPVLALEERVHEERVAPPALEVVLVVPRVEPGKDEVIRLDREAARGLSELREDMFEVAMTSRVHLVVRVDGAVQGVGNVGPEVEESLLHFVWRARVIDISEVEDEIMGLRSLDRSGAGRRAVSPRPPVAEERDPLEAGRGLGRRGREAGTRACRVCRATTRRH